VGRRKYFVTLRKKLPESKYENMLRKRYNLDG